jgi:hypothetical protein
MFHRIHDFGISGTPADVSGQCVSHRFPVRGRIAGQKGRGGHKHARGAETALHGPMVDKRLLQR